MNPALFFISSGLFLGWSLGANDAANLFGVAVGANVIRFRSAAAIMSVFIILGAVVSGAGASNTLGRLGSIPSLPGAFIVALSSALAIFAMTKYGLPVSTSQSIVGAIVGWNLFAAKPTSASTLTTIVLTWIVCPFLSAALAVIFYKMFKRVTRRLKANLFLRHYFIRLALIGAGGFGAYALGANNIANVMGVFTRSVELEPVSFFMFSISKTQILFFAGGLAIAAGVFTYSGKVMATIGKDIYSLSPVTALIVVLASSTVLFLFASASLQQMLISLRLPPLPLVPVSSSQAVVGAIIGVGAARGDRNINMKKLRRIALGWILTPALALVISYISLFFMQNVFLQGVV